MALAGFCFYPSCFSAEASPASSHAPNPQTSITVRWLPDPDNTNDWKVEARGLDASNLRELRRARWTEANWQKLLPVIAGSSNLLADLGLPPMLGGYRINGEIVEFKPRFPLQPGVSYRAILQPSQLPVGGHRLSPVSASLVLPKPSAAPSTSVTEIYPTATELPENLLKFYLQFSAPMSGGHIYDYIHLLNQNGQPVELPFLEIDEELWNPAMTRLTLFIDPGRIKRGVTPLEEVGPALENGRHYTLVIDAAWRDSKGAPLKSTHRKSFRVIPPDRTPIDLQRWKVVSPTAGSNGPLFVQFDRPMDFALAQRVIKVRDGTHESLEGTVALHEHERAWSFTPIRPWTRGPHELLIQTTLEDLAGNNIGKSFEVDLFAGVERKVQATQQRLPFEVK